MFQSMESFENTEVQKIQFGNSQELLAVLVASASILSLSGEKYQVDTIREIYIPSDLVILTFGVPLLFASAYESTLIPGVLAYQMYSSLTYVLAFRASPGWVFCLHLIVFCMSASKFYETTQGFKRLFGRQATTTTSDNEEESSETSEAPAPFKYAGFILILWGMLVSLRSSLRMQLFDDQYLSLTESSSVDATQLLVGMVWMIGGISLCRHANLQLGLCLLLQLSAFIYGSLLILLIQYCVMENATDSKVQEAAMLGFMALSVLIPLERFFSHASRRSHQTPKELEG